jgi:hypothetical protein
MVVGVGSGVSLGRGVDVGGTGVEVGGNNVAVAVGGKGVADGGTLVAVGGIGVAVGTGVAVGAAAHATTVTRIKTQATSIESFFIPESP